MLLKLNRRSLLVLAVLFILIIIPTSFATDIANESISADDTIITTDETTIYVSNGETDGDGSQSNPYNSISKAVSEYNSTKNSNIYIKNGNYEITDAIEITKDTTIIGESQKNTILDAKNAGGSIFKIKDAKVTLINLTLINANQALLIDKEATDTDLNIDKCTFEKNTNGAIYYHEYYISHIKINIENSIFKNNKNQDNGGAISVYGGDSLIITNSLFENNALPLGERDVNSGGAVYVGGNLKNIYIDECNFTNNSAIRGSAIGFYYAGNANISNCIFKNNTSPGNPNYKDDIVACVIWDSSSKAKLYLNKNTFENNKINDDVTAEGDVEVLYLDKNAKISGSDVDKYFGDGYDYKITLVDNDGNPLANKEITATLKNTYNQSITTIKNTTNSEGIAIFSLKNQVAGKYIVTALFEGDDDYDKVSYDNKINIRTDNDYNIIFEPSSIKISEGDSYVATGHIYDEYLIPAKLNGATFTVDWYDNFGKHLIIQGGSYTVTEGNKIEFDINRCHLITRDEAYELYFTVSSAGTGILTVDTSKDLSKIDSSLDTIYVSNTRGSDETGDGSFDKPLSTIQTALSANYKFGGGKTIIVEEGTYEISTFTVLGDVTIVGVKGKTILKQTAGVLGMLDISSKNTVKLINLTLINGFATPTPDSLIHVYDDSIIYIDGCEFYNNTAYAGGAIVVSTGGSAYINNSYFHENNGRLNTNVGGAIYVERGYLYVTNSVFENNTASDGGVLFLGFESEADLINTTFKNNKAYITTHTEGGGGAIFTRSNNLNIENCSFIENYADLNGGAIYIDYGAVNIVKSYFENNMVKYNGESKGSAIESTYANCCNLTLNYSILISNDTHAGHYLVYIHQIDENYTVDLNYNYWKTTAAKASPGVVNEIKIVVSSENEYIYTGDVVEFTIELVNSNIENGTSPLNGIVHDLALLLKPTIGEIENPIVIVKDNKATFIYKATKMGTETIQMGDVLLYNTYRFDVQDGSDKIDLNPSIQIKPDKSTEITVSLDEDISGNITIRVDGKDYSVKVDNAKAVLDVPTLPGNHEAKIIYTGTETYRGFVITKSFNVARFASEIIVSDITTYFNGDFEAKLLTDEGTPIANENIIIIINGTEYNVKTDENGIATLELNLPSVGTYNVTTKFEGNAYYNSSNASSKINVEFASLKLSFNENVIITTMKGSFSFNLTDDKGKAIKNTEILITFNGQTYKVKTDAEGIATLNLNNNMLSVDTYPISAKVEETSVYTEATADTTLKIIKATAIIKVENITVYANTGELTVTLVDEDGAPITDTNITVELNGIKALKTNENGIAILKLDLTPGNYTTSIKLVENNIYTANDVTSSISVKETITSIYAPEITIYYANGKFEVILLDVSGKPIANERLIITILNDNNYIATTNENGIASINVNNLAIGSYKVNISFEGKNSIFEASSTTSNINIVSSIESDDITRAYNSGYDFIATIKDPQGNGIANSSVTLLVNGKQYIVKSDENGVVKLAEKLSPGTYAITLVNPVTGERTSNYATIKSRINENKNLIMDYNAGTSYKVRILGDDGNVVGAGEIVVFKINGKTTKVKTDKNGYASLKITNTPKKYTITATYKGQTVKNTVTVKQILKANKKTTTAKKSAKKITLKATLKSSKGKAIKGKKITFKLNGKKYTAKTNKNGVAKVTIKKSAIKKLKKGKKYTVSVTYLKDTVKCYVKIKK